MRKHIREISVDEAVGIHVTTLAREYGSVTIDLNNGVWTVSHGAHQQKNKDLLEAIGDLEWDLEFSRCNCDPTTGEPPPGVKSTHDISL